MKLILTADWHLRDDTPRCRTDDFQKAQWGKVEETCQLSHVLDSPILIAGDIFDIGRSSQETEAKLLCHLGKNMTVVATAGNHDLPYHSMKQITDSSINVMFSSGGISPAIFGGESYVELFDSNNNRKIHVYGFPWGMPLEFDATKLDKNAFNVALVHAYVYNKKSFNSEKLTMWKSDAFLDKFKGFDLVVSGDNHHPFVVNPGDGRLLVNPGSLARQAADELHQPRIYIYDTKTYELEEHKFYIDPGAVTDIHLVTEHQREGRLTNLIEIFQKGAINTNSGEALDVFKDMENFIIEKRDEIDTETEELIWESLGTRQEIG